MDSPNDDAAHVDLSRVAYVREYVERHYSSESLPTKITKGYIIYLQDVKCLTVNEIIDLITANTPAVNVKALSTILRRVIKEFVGKKRCGLSQHTNQHLLKLFLAEAIDVPTSSVIPSSSPSVIPSSSPSVIPSSSPSVIPSSSPSVIHPSSPSVIHPSSPSVIHPSSHSAVPLSSPTIRSDCVKCSAMRLSTKQAHEKFTSKANALGNTVSLLKRKFDSKQISQYKKRKTIQIEERNNIIKEKNKEIVTLRSQLAALTDASVRADRLSKSNSILQKENISLQSELQSARHKVCDLESQIVNLHHIIASNQTSSSDDSDVVVTKKDNRQFSLNVRKVVYFHLLHNIPVEVIGSVIEHAFFTLIGTKIPSTPSPVTCAQMVREIGLLSDLQSVETIMSATCCCLSWDATTLSGSHPNEFHISTPHATVTLNIRNLPGGRAADYAHHIISTLDEVSGLYADFHHLQKDTILSSIHGKIMSTLTDRVAANHATVVILEDHLGRSLLELNCQIHPLDGLASAARSCLKSLESEQQLTTKALGSDCQVANVLHLISKLRYKAKGDPGGFKAFLRQKGLPVGLFVRYVGNRLHVLFHLAGTVFHRRDVLLEYTEGMCNSEKMSAALKHDLQKPFICHELQALGLLGKLVTGPWMALVYTDVTERKHFELSRCLVSAVSTLQRLESAADDMITMDCDVFGRPLVMDDVLISLRISDDLPGLTSVLSQLISSFLVVLNKQLAKYLRGELSEPTQETINAACAAPAHNIWAERTLGLYDAQHRRAPNATGSFLDSKCKASVNKTMLWLDSKVRPDQQALVDFAARVAGRKRKLEGAASAVLHDEIMKRIAERRQSRDMTVRRKVAKVLKAAVVAGSLQVDALAAVCVDVSDSNIDLIVSVLQSPQSLLRKCFRHVWNVKGQDIVFSGRVLKFKITPTKSYFIMSYWTEAEDEDDSVDHKLNFEDLLADIAFGDFLFL